MNFSRDVCLHFEAALGRHWLETDGLGGFAASSLFLCPTSRFHGLLVVPTREQPRRHLMLARFEETLHGEGRQFPISDARFGGKFSPGGHRFVDRCDFDPRPRFTYRIGHVTVVREVQMVRGQQTVLLRYRVTGQRVPLELRLRPIVPFRAANGLTWQNDSLDESVGPLPNGISVRPYDSLPALAISMTGNGAFEQQPLWYRGIEYTDDVARGYEGHEDQWSPGELWVRMESGAEIFVAATVGEPVADPAAAWRKESRRRKGVSKRSTASGGGASSTSAAVVESTAHATSATKPAGNGADKPLDVRAHLDVAADHFLYRTFAGRPGVIAGFPWFEEWGRDTLIALPGLTLARGEVEACGDVLSGLRTFLRDGRLPNVFGDSPETSDYKAVDPSMWYGRAVRLYMDAGGDEERLLEELLPTLTAIAEAHRAADTPGLACTPEGLLRAGVPEIATTWMDAVVDGLPVTPRDGLQVEVNALWYVLLDTLAELLRRKGVSAKTWTKLRDTSGAAFLQRFWIERRNRLADRVAHGDQDDTVRPNMVIAASLPQSPLSVAQRRSVVDLARAELLTPRGLRTLSPRYLRYRGRFAGNQHTRDEAYHQGTVWPWLLGPYVEASLLAYPGIAAVRTHVREVLDGFGEHLGEHGVGQISEVFDGDPPHRPGGCFAQAWSVGELLRGYALLDGVPGADGAPGAAAGGKR